MANPRISRENLILFAFLIILVIIMALVYKSPSFTIVTAAISVMVLGVVISRLLISRQRLTIIKNLYDREKNRDLSLASQILARIVRDSSGPRSLSKIAADCISEKFDSSRFAVFFRDGEKYVPRAFLNLSSRFLYSPPWRRSGKPLRRSARMEA
jgi:hypothetical protein